MRLILLNLFLCISVALLAQAPQGFKYQAVVRDNNGNVLVNKIVGVRTSILKGSPNGNAEYIETSNLATNDFGVIALEIGKGTATSGTFASINWGNDTYFIKTEVDLSGGSNYQFMGTSQLLSVPYALHANTSSKANNDNDTSATNEIQNLNISGQNLSISGSNTITLPNTNTDNQTLSLNGNQLSISGGNVINIPPDNDADTTNEIQNLSFTSGTLTLSKGNSVTIPDNQTLILSGQNLTIANGNTVTVPDNQTLSLNANVLTISGGNNVVLPNDSDANPTNEIQALSLQNDTLYLSNGGYVNMAPFKDNTDSQQLSISGNQLQISGGNAVTITNVVDLDADPTNELQYLSRSGDTLYLSNGNYVVMPHDDDADPTNELQTLTITQDSIKLSGGGGSLALPTPTNAIVPSGGCINSTNIIAPNGYIYTGENSYYKPRINQIYDTLAANIFKPIVLKYNNWLLIIQQSTQSIQNFNKVIKYDLNSKLASEFPNSPTSRNYAVPLIKDNFLYLFGGYYYNGSNLVKQKTIEVLNLNTGIWQTKNDLYSSYFVDDTPFPYISGNFIYMIGGQNGDQSSLEVSKYDVINDTWSSNLTGYNIWKTKTILFNNQIYVLGYLTQESRLALFTLDTVNLTLNHINNLTTTGGIYYTMFEHDNKLLALYSEGGKTVISNLMNNEKKEISGSLIDDLNIRSYFTQDKSCFFISGHNLIRYDVENNELSTFYLDENINSISEIIKMGGKFYMSYTNDYDELYVIELTSRIFYLHCVD